MIEPQPPEPIGSDTATGAGAADATIGEVVACGNGSTSTDSLLQAAAAIAKALSVPVRVLHARQGPLREKEFEVVRLAAAKYRLALDTVEAVEQTPWEVNGAILGYLRERPTALPVLAAHARHSPTKVLLGSVSSVLVRELGRPALVMGPDAVAPDAVSRVMVTVDGSRFAENAIEVGVAFARQLDVELWLVEMLEEGTQAATNLAGTAWKLGVRYPNLRVGWETLHGSRPERAIVDYVGKDPSTILVAATHGRTALSEIVLGSVANGLVRHAAGPVLLVCPPQPDRHAT